ncbi:MULTISPECIES: hypothetical protein [Bacillus subtilis group]|uniref:hypothetical protein n=1 Tax=Bacillus TaxID=1386 RepID=UPI00119D52AF|nr:MULTISPECIES: hypothetical protein [Bacillus subtilis group]MBT3123211.1 hypothetical protein [Bacillus inaquosorum]MCB5337330.1 hypothetical protein [Bacillus amyloliquefaciens]MCF7615372.1 hypothetical protein [Bacillus subtilis]QWK35300.1 hypothetical protein KM843_20555 [Bacillus velezensis]
MDKVTISREESVFHSVLKVDGLEVNDKVTLQWGKSNVTARINGETKVSIFTSVVDLIAYLHSEKLFKQSMRDRGIGDYFVGVDYSPLHTRVKEGLEDDEESK